MTLSLDHRYVDNEEYLFALWQLNYKLFLSNGPQWRTAPTVGGWSSPGQVPETVAGAKIPPVIKKRRRLRPKTRAESNQRPTRWLLVLLHPKCPPTTADHHLLFVFSCNLLIVRGLGTKLSLAWFTRGGNTATQSPDADNNDFTVHSELVVKTVN